MKRVSTLLMALALPVLLLGCEDDDDVTGLTDCASLAGNFRATDFGFANSNRSMVRDFDQAGATFMLRLNNNRMFESNFAEPNQTPLARTGSFQATANQLLLGNQNLFRGAEAGEQRFTCERLSNTRFRLRSTDPVRFDFNRNNVFDAGEVGFFEGEFMTI